MGFAGVSLLLNIFISYFISNLIWERKTVCKIRAWHSVVCFYTVDWKYSVQQGFDYIHSLHSLLEDWMKFKKNWCPQLCLLWVSSSNSQMNSGPPHLPKEPYPFFAAHRGWTPQYLLPLTICVTCHKVIKEPKWKHLSCSVCLQIHVFQALLSQL